MNSIKTSITAIIILLGGTNIIYAQTTDENAKTKFSIEVDPMTYLLKGYSVHLRIQPKNSEHLLLGVGLYAMDMPDPFVNMNSENKDAGWDVRINQGVGLFGEYHFSEVNSKFFVGAQLSIQEYKIEQESAAGSSKYTNALGMAYVGYTIKPFDNELYFKPWAGIGYTEKISGSNELNGETYSIESMVPFATLHVGYTF